jgi:hypothetical protein
MIWSIKTAIIGAGAAFMIGATTAWWTTSKYKDAKFDAFKAAGDAAYAQAQAKAVEIELKNQVLAKELDSAYKQNKRDLDRLTSELATVRLRDPNARSCPVPITTPSTGDSQDQTPGADLSEELTRLLRTESRRADEAALYAQTCYQWIRDLGHVQAQ